MFSYLIVAFELLILYLVYYYLYIWEPRDFRINKDIWGVYEGHKHILSAKTKFEIIFSNRWKNGFKIINQ